MKSLRKFLIFSLIFTFFVNLFANPVKAIYNPVSVPNNPYGIHILDTGEVEKAASLVNSSGGDWGYVTIPIRANDRDLDKWTKFMQDCTKLHVIPLMRIASYPKGDSWVAPNELDLVDFANFLDELPWPIVNRYVIIYNEPNHKNEWGGFVYPEEYSRVLSRAADIFHKKNSNYYVIGGGMDSSAPSGGDSLNIFQYFIRMNEAVPGIFKQIDAMSYHSYGNPAFSAAPNLYSAVNINGFRNEAEFIKDRFDVDLPIFITEAGWDHKYLSDNQMTTYYEYALNNVWTDKVVALTPFLLNAGDGPFVGFSFQKQSGDLFPFADAFKKHQKTKGQPQTASYLTNQKSETTQLNNSPISNNPLNLNLGMLINLITSFFNK